MDKEKVKNLREKIAIALRSVENALDVKINVGRITYSDSDFKVQLAGVDAVAGANNFLETEFLSKCGLYGLKPEHLGQKIKIGGDVHRIVGLKVRNRKYPIITKNMKNCKEYKLTQWTVENALKERDGRLGGG